MTRGAGKFVLREHDPRRARIIRIGSVVLAVLLVSAMTTLAYRLGGDRNERLVEERDDLLLKLAETEADVRRLRERVAILERRHQVAKDAEVRTREELLQRDRVLADLRAEIAFYESLVSSGDAAEGLQIHSLRLSEGPAAGNWAYQLTLTHDAREAPEARGRVEWGVEGLEAGEIRRLAGAELGIGNGGAGLEYAFKYFQVIRGDLFLPADFVPRRVDLRLVPADPGAGAVTRSFEWRQITDEGDARNVQS